MGSGAQLRVVTDQEAEVGSAGSRSRSDVTAPPHQRQRHRIVAAAHDCVERQGVAATTVDDIARAAGCSRATVYRIFSGGREAVLAALAETEIAYFLSDLAVRLGAADSVGSVLVQGIAGAGSWLAQHPIVRRLIDEEPEVVLPWLSFDRQGEVLAFISNWAAPFLGRWMDRQPALRTAEWAARIVLAYGVGRSTAGDLTDELWVRRLVLTFVLPAVEASGGSDVSSVGSGSGDLGLDGPLGGDLGSAGSVGGDPVGGGSGRSGSGSVVGGLFDSQCIQSTGGNP